MTSNIPQELLETNLIPAVVPDNKARRIISEQPRPGSLPRGAERKEGKRPIQHYNRRNQAAVPKPVKTSGGLVHLRGCEEVVISLESSCFQCSASTAKYFIRDKDTLVLEGSELVDCTTTFCNFGNLRNVVLRDAEDVPVARVCLKEKHFLLESMVLAIYSPPEILIGTVEESPSCYLQSQEFILGNADGDYLFRIVYSKDICTSQFQITSLQNDANQQEAQILEKSGAFIRLKFFSQMNLTAKLILLGFCIGVVKKRTMNQDFIPVPIDSY